MARNFLVVNGQMVDDTLKKYLRGAFDREGGKKRKRLAAAN